MDFRRLTRHDGGKISVASHSGRDRLRVMTPEMRLKSQDRGVGEAGREIVIARLRLGSGIIHITNDQNRVTQSWEFVETVCRLLHSVH